MDKVKQSFNKLCDIKYRTYGFRRFNCTYARIQSDMLQSFSLRKSNGRDLYNVFFGIVPLCNTILSLDMEIYSLDQLCDDAATYSYGWSPDLTEIDAEQACSQRIITAIEKNLMPLFLKCSNCKVALNELIKIEMVLENNRKISLQREGRSDCAESQFSSSLFDPNKYCLALKAKDYTYMKKHLLLKLSFYDKRISAIENGELQQPDVVYQHFIQEREETRKQLLKLEVHDDCYFDQLVAKQEQQTTMLLKEKYPKIFK